MAAPVGSARSEPVSAVVSLVMQTAAAKEAGLRLFPARVDLRGLDVE
jgi:hypothetical protein